MIGPLLAFVLAAGSPADDAGLARGRELTASFYAGESETLWALFSADLRQAIGAPADLASFRTSVEDQFGAETNVLSESVDFVPGRPEWKSYARRALFERATLVVQWTFDARGAVEGFFVKPADQEALSAHLDYQTKAALRLPFDGEWFVFWGGRTLKQNQHAVAPDQRFAYDFVMVKRGSSHAGSGARNGDYLCFGQRVLAPADGVVVEAVDGIEDNLPGVMNAKAPLGNHVIIEHGNGEFSFLAHFKKGTLALRAGDSVKAGAILGRDGNSGRSSEPHVHYHLQTTAVFARGEGLPAQFQGYLVNGKPVPRGEPVAGQLVATPGTKASR